ncbi:MAG: HEPN domain-containing protein [Candidatus Marinimicrobia bacterium]|nr:HEPN domain-containing protein [Candidatus Neomarinimicrobiota bacterium]
MKKNKTSLYIAEKWLNFADEDYRLVTFLWNKENKFYRSICFHAHQFIEKVLKGIREGAGLSPPRIHDINALVKRVAKLNFNVPLKENEILFLSSIYIDIRYPPDVGLLPKGEPTQRDVEIVVRAVKKLKEWIT